MKKQILISLIIISSGLTMNAQWTYPNGSAYYQGVVGIGTNYPEAKLHIFNSYDTSCKVGLKMFYQNSWGTADYATNYRFIDISSTEGGNIFQMNGYGIGIGYNPPNYASNDRLYINGNVGIGTTAPSTQLHIKDGNGLHIQASNAQLKMSDVSSSINLRMDNNGNLELLNNAQIPICHFNKSGNVGIGTINPDSRFKLDVEGTIRAKEIKVCLQGGCDFVFKKDYKLMDLNELEKFVTTKQHLPEIASEKEMIENGLNMKEFQMKLLQKMEEMTLYVIEQNKQLKLQSDKNEKQEEELKILKAEIKKLKSTKR